MQGVSESGQTATLFHDCDGLTERGIVITRCTVADLVTLG